MMSKINYLLIILFLLIIGFVVAGQLQLATESATQLTIAELVHSIDIHISRCHRQLKRYPNADKEFETMVLDKLNFSRFPTPILIQNFQPGNQRMPATFRLLIKNKTNAKGTSINLAYYGSDYDWNFLFKGLLVRRTSTGEPDRAF
jgi:hypothetical protein